MNICVYCASSLKIAPSFHSVATDLGRIIAEGGHTLVYGGGNVGLMGTLAKSVHEYGGTVVGVIPRALQEIEGRAYDVADELIVTDTMQERKRIMFTRADGFAILPGGIGTLEEFFEVLTLRKLGYHDKPITIVNKDRFFDPLLDLLNYVDKTRFSPGVTDGTLYTVSEDAMAAVGHLNHAIVI